MKGTHKNEHQDVITIIASSEQSFDDAVAKGIKQLFCWLFTSLKSKPSVKRGQELKGSYAGGLLYVRELALPPNPFRLKRRGTCPRGGRDEEKPSSKAAPCLLPSEAEASVKNSNYLTLKK